MSSPDTRSRRLRSVLIGAALLVAGAAGGSAVTHAIGPTIDMAPLTPVTIAHLADTRGPVTLKGRVAQIYGHDLIVDDGTGKALVDTGPQGDRLDLTPGAERSFQGHFDEGIFHADFIVDGNGSVTPLGPPAGPPDACRRRDRMEPPPPPPPFAPDPAAPPAPVPAPPPAGQ
ncbi:hypothetical protein [Acidomonas methanolica]|uniref:hypothetical protein n=1 Tax=Acidomonas methanolica TaxID=437 RepID=UPI00211A188C|nr:hypothetical protein [Acidomonas methanolica]MCQ9155859.1 hypothetical protein [Acidomonas methanolica]